MVHSFLYLVPGRSASSLSYGGIQDKTRRASSPITWNKELWESRVFVCVLKYLWWGMGGFSVILEELEVRVGVCDK